MPNYTADELNEYGVLGDKLANQQNPDLKKFSDADLQKMFSVLLDRQKQAQLNDRLQQASNLEDMNAKNPDRGQSVPTGSVYIPPNPLESGMNMASHLSAIMDKYKGIKQQGDIDSDRQKYADALRKLRNASSTLGGTSTLSNAFDGQSGQDYADSNSNVG